MRARRWERTGHQSLEANRCVTAALRRWLINRVEKSVTIQSRPCSSVDSSPSTRERNPCARNDSTPPLLPICDARPSPKGSGFLILGGCGPSRDIAMREFVRSTFSIRKLQGLCVNTALGNFVGYVAGSLVTLLTTYHTVERRAFKNLFGILPRHTVVVHRLPQWLEWALSILLGYLVMELVRYIFRSHRQLPNHRYATSARDLRSGPQATGG